MTINKTGSFLGRVAFVTGAANGIGRAAALAFAREGASVVVADVSAQGNQETARMIKELSGRVLAVRCDVTRAEDVKAALDKAIEAFGRLRYWTRDGRRRRPNGVVMFVASRGNIAAATTFLRKIATGGARSREHYLVDGRWSRRAPIAQARKKTIKKSYGHKSLLY